MQFEDNPLKKLLYNLIKLSKADLDRRFTRAKIGITPLQYGVLAMTKSNPLTINDIARRFNFKAPSLVPAVDVLETGGLLKRGADRLDRRKIQLIITNKGRQLLKTIPFDDKNDALNKAFKKLGPVKQTRLLSLLRELNNNFPENPL